MILLKWIWAEDIQGHVDPETIYYALRLVMFVLSFVLEDWAVYEMVHSPRHQRQAVILLASSYVTWSYQSHTFSNSIETLLVAWSLVLIERILHQKVRVNSVNLSMQHAFASADTIIESVLYHLLWNPRLYLRLWHL